MSLALRAGPIPASAADRLREITTALAPTLRVDELNPLYDLYRQLQRPVNFSAYLLATVTLSVLLLSAAGLYALMSFTVNQRRREIGIHSALGGIFKWALGQVAAGTVVGVLAALLLGYYMQEELVRNVPAVIPAAAALMMVIGLLAAAGPSRSSG